MPTLTRREKDILAITKALEELRMTATLNFRRDPTYPLYPSSEYERIIDRILRQHDTAVLSTTFSQTKQATLHDLERGRVQEVLNRSWNNTIYSYIERMYRDIVFFYLQDVSGKFSQHTGYTGRNPEKAARHIADSFFLRTGRISESNNVLGSLAGFRVESRNPIAAIYNAGGTKPDKHGKYSKSKKRRITRNEIKGLEKRIQARERGLKRQGNLTPEIINRNKALIDFLRFHPGVRTKFKPYKDFKERTVLIFTTALNKLLGKQSKQQVIKIVETNIVNQMGKTIDQFLGTGVKGGSQLDVQRTSRSLQLPLHKFEEAIAETVMQYVTESLRLLR